MPLSRIHDRNIALPEGINFIGNEKYAAARHAQADFDPGFAMHYRWGQPLELLSKVAGSGENTFASTIAAQASAIQNKVDAAKELIQ